MKPGSLADISALIMALSFKGILGYADKTEGVCLCSCQAEQGATLLSLLQDLDGLSPRICALFSICNNTNLICSILPLCPIRSKSFCLRVLWEVQRDLQQLRNPFFGHICASRDERPVKNMKLSTSNHYNSLTSDLVLCYLASAAIWLEFQICAKQTTTETSLQQSFCLLHPFIFCVMRLL